MSEERGALQAFPAPVSTGQAKAPPATSMLDLLSPCSASRVGQQTCDPAPTPETAWESASWQLASVTCARTTSYLHVRDVEAMAQPGTASAQLLGVSARIKPHAVLFNSRDGVAAPRTVCGQSQNTEDVDGPLTALTRRRRCGIHARIPCCLPIHPGLDW